MSGISRPDLWMQLSVMIEAGIQASIAVKTINKVKHRDSQALTRMAAFL